jgi:acetyl esterase/lipase
MKILKQLFLALIGLAWALPADAARPVSQSELRRAGPGDILRIMPLPGGAPNGVRAYQILYRSTGLRDEPILVSGALFYADGDEPRRRPVVAWAHPTTGVTRNCSPTRQTDVYNRIPGMDRMMAEGFVVVATDYAGFASLPPHPYLVGASQARAVLDSVRAVRQLRNARASDQFIVWGHSQGGHAALFTGELQRVHAPELELAGVVAAAPATRLADLFKSDAGTVWGNALTAMTLYSWSHVYGIPADTVVHRDALPAFRRLGQDCLESLGDVFKILQDEKPLERRFFKRDPTEDPEWRRIMDENSPGKGPIRAPVLIAQGRKDDIVPYPVTRRFTADSCSLGTPIQFIDMPGTDHMYAAENSARQSIQWMKDRFAGRRIRNWC